MKITMLGTGHAMVTELFNTCFLMDNDAKLFLVDTGGGNTLLTNIRHAGYNWTDVHDVFISHRHTDHLLGVFWIIRTALGFMSHGRFDGEVNIYSHAEVISIIRETVKLMFPGNQTAFIDHGVNLIQVEDKEERSIVGKNVTFFDTGSQKDKQFGFCMDLGPVSGEADGTPASRNTLTFCGDEPLEECCYQYARESAWLMHEAFCMDADNDIFHPARMRHSTVKDACLLAEDLKVKNLVLYHTEDTHGNDRKQLYMEEGKQYFHGNLLVPDDLEAFEL